MNPESGHFMKQHSSVDRHVWVSRHKMQAVALLVIWFLSLLVTTTDSQARGLTSEWSPPINFSRAGDLISNTPVLLCDANQNTHMFWVERTDEQAYIYYSSDASGNWREPIDILVAPRVNLLDAAITPSLQAHLVWATGNGGALVYTNAPLAEAGDPRSWSSPRTLVSDINAMSDVYGGGNTLFADSNGMLHLVYSQPNDAERFSNSLYYIRSENGGTTWSDPTLITTLVAPETSSMSGNIAVDNTGRLHVAWDVRSDQYGSFSQLGYVRSMDSGKTWGHAFDLAIGSPPFGAAMAAVFAFGDNEVHLTWDIPDRLHRWSTDGGETWSGPIPIMSLGAAYGGFNKLAKDSAGTLHVIAAVGNGVYHASWNGTWNPAQAIELRESDPHGQQFVICKGNQLHVAYYDRTGENEIWYSTKPTNAPEIARTAIKASEASPISIPTVKEPSPKTLVLAATQPPDNAEQKTQHPSSSPRPKVFAPMIVGVVPSALLVIGVMVARLAQRRR